MNPLLLFFKGLFCFSNNPTVLAHSMELMCNTNIVDLNLLIVIFIYHFVSNRIKDTCKSDHSTCN